MHVRIRIDSLRNNRFTRLSVPIRVYTIDRRVDDDENTFLYVLQVIFNDQSGCMSSISLIMSFFTKIASVDFLEIGLTRH